MRPQKIWIRNKIWASQNSGTKKNFWASKKFCTLTHFRSEKILGSKTIFHLKELLIQKFGWVVVVLKPILVFRLSLGQAEQKFPKKIPQIKKHKHFWSYYGDSGYQIKLIWIPWLWNDQIGSRLCSKAQYVLSWLFLKRKEKLWTQFW